MSISTKDSSLQDLIISLVSYTISISIFIYIMFNLESNADFVYNSAIILFIIEFFSLHSSFLLNSSSKITTKVGLSLIYIFMVAIFSVSSGTIYPALFFIFSIVGKVFQQKAKSENKIAYSLLIFMFATFFVVIFEGAINTLLPAPKELIDMKPEGDGGVFIESPTTVIAWGILYYGLLVSSELIIYLGRHRKHPFRASK